MATAIRMENVSKRFILHHEKHRSFQDLFVNIYKRDGSREEFWALRDIDIEIKQGQTVGIIGRNGSGKSTMLKLISRILEPTTGAVKVNGKISALLELGAGFHPDLTGKENIYLNGSLLGLSKKEMDRRYDEIVDFSGLGHFIDTPVKHFSSGMYMRLGFSIAIAVDPDILLADEVLAVGDEAFQRRCLDRMYELRRSNKTVVIVSHDLISIREFCDHAIWLEGGRVRQRGVPLRLVDDYVMEADRGDARGNKKLRTSSEAESNVPASLVPVPGSPDVTARWGSSEAEIRKVEFCDSTGRSTSLFETGGDLIVRLHFVARKRIDHPVFGLAIHRTDGTHICGPNTKTSGVDIEAIEGAGIIEFVVDDLPLLEGRYLLTAVLYDWSGRHAYDHHERMYSFSVISRITRERFGSVLLRSRWQTDRLAGHEPRHSELRR